MNEHKWECKDIYDVMQVKQSEIRTNGPWRMRTGHANGMWWIPGRHAVAHVEARETRECEIREMRGNARPARYVSAQITNCVGSRDVHNSWDAWKREESETRNARDAKYTRCVRYAENAKCEICEMRGNAKCARYAELREMCRNAKCEIREMRGNAKMRQHENHEGRRTSTGPV